MPGSMDLEPVDGMVRRCVRINLSPQKQGPRSSDLCYQPLLWLGGADPTDSVFEAMEENPDRDLLLRLLDAWMLVFGKTATMAHDAIRRTSSPSNFEHAELREVLMTLQRGFGREASTRTYPFPFMRAGPMLA